MILTGNLLDLAYEELCHKLDSEFATTKEPNLISRIFGMVREGRNKKRLFRTPKRITTIEGDYPFSITQYELRLDHKQLAVAFFEHYRNEDITVVFESLCRQAFLKTHPINHDEHFFVKCHFLFLARSTTKVGERVVHVYKGLTDYGHCVETQVFNPASIEAALKRNHQTRPYIEAKG